MPRRAIFGLLLLAVGAILWLGGKTPSARNIAPMENEAHSAQVNNADTASVRAGLDDDDSIDEQRAVARRSTQSVDSLAAALSSDDEATRLHAAMALGGKGATAKAAVSQLEKMLADARAEARLEAAIALGRIGPDAKSASTLLEAIARDGDATVRWAAAESLASVEWEPLGECRFHDFLPSVHRENGLVRLNILPREDDPGHPPEGWCGEVAIQESLLYAGAYFPQKAINAAGRPEHPDLYSHEIPVALQNLGAICEEWPPSGERRPTLDRFLAWIRRQVADGCPVLVGVKIYPTEHDAWSLDHFSLVVGATADALVINTTWGYSVTCSDAQLTSLYDGFSFKNKFDQYYGKCIRGMKDAAGSPTVRLHVLSESNDAMNVVAKCENLDIGGEYALFKSAGALAKNAAPLRAFKAKHGVFALYDRIGKDRPCIYRCRKWPAGRQ